MKPLLLSLPLLVVSFVPLNFHTVQKSVRPLQDANGRNICTVTSINQDKKLWLTAAHCVLNGQTGMHDAVFIETHPAEIIFADAAIDLAVVRVAEMDVPALKIAKQMPTVGSKILLIGHPEGLDQVHLFQGYVSSLRTEVEPTWWYMTFDMTACGGNSGSVVVNGKDEVVSVLQIGWGRGCSAFSGGATWQALGKVRKYFG